MKYLLIILIASLSVTSIGQNFTTVGQPYIVQNTSSWNNDAFGKRGLCSSLSGNTLIVSANEAGGSNYYGEVYVFELINNTWTQKGQTISGNYNDNFGYATAINYQGNRIAASSRTRLSTRGVVKIYEFTGNTWSQLGQDILGASSGDFSGSSIAMNAAGDIVAIGAPFNDGGGSSSGEIRVYHYDGTNWVKIGSDINGLTSNAKLGTSVALDSSGTVLAAGGSGSSGNSAYAVVYDWDGTTWTQRGQIFSEYGTNLGYSLDLSSEGNNIIVGGPEGSINLGTNKGIVKIFSWDGTSWIQKGQDLVGISSGLLKGYDVSINHNSSRISITLGGALPSTFGARGRLEVFDFINNSWVIAGTIDGSGSESGLYFTDLNGNGNRIFTSGGYNLTGFFKVYSLGICSPNSNTITSNGGTLSLTPDTSVSIQWYDCINNSLVTGQNSFNFSPSFCGEFAAILTSNSGCIDTTSCFSTVTSNFTIYDTVWTNTTIYDTITTYDTIFNTITIYDTLTTYDTIFLSVTDTLYIDVNLSGIPFITNTIKVYPNPTSDQVIIDNGNYTAMGSGGYIINILNSTGQQVFSSPVNQQTFTIDISQFGSNGLYYLQILNANLSVVEVKHIILH